MRLSSLVAVVVLLLGPGLAQAGSGFLPPLELEVGRAAIESPRGDAVLATQVMVGLSWASLYPRPTPVDVSIGWLGSFGPAPEPGASARRVAAPDPGGHDASGGFVDLGVRAAAGDHWRVWVSGRGEWLATDDTSVLGGFGRVSTELWTPTVASGGGGGIVGTIAVAAWAELGVRERADRSLATVVAAGLGLRLPLVVASR